MPSSQSRSRSAIDRGVTGFWREDKLQQIVPPLVAQVSRCVSAGGQGPKDVMSAGLVALGGAVNDDDLLKKINLDVLMHTRSEDARVRLFALQCACALWAAHGHKLMGAHTVGSSIDGGFLLIDRSQVSCRRRRRSSRSARRTRTTAS